MLPPKPGAKPIPYTRATTLAGAIDDKSGLMLWKQRLTALGLVDRRDLLTAIAATDPGDKKALNRLVEEAAEHAGATAAATIGTALHTFTERIDLGLDVGPVPAGLEADLHAYRAFTAAAAWHVEAVEVFLVNHAYTVAGTADRIVRIDGRNYIADVKSSQSVDFVQSWAAQTAIYANSLPWDYGKGCTVPWGVDGQPEAPSKDRALIIHMPAGQGRCSAYWIDIKAGWDAVRLAVRVREYRAKRDLLTAYQPGEASLEDAVGDPIRARIATAASVEELTAIWAEHQDTWTDTYTAAAAARKREVA